jgi:hypothetical protein
MASRYGLGIVGGTASLGLAQCELRAGPVDCIWVKELGIFLNAATASTIGFGKPANVPAGGSPVLGQATNGGSPAVGGVVSSGWSTAPTAPTIFYRRMGLPAAIGNGIIWTFEGDGLLVPQSGALVVWNITLGSIASIYWVWEE